MRTKEYCLEAYKAYEDAVVKIPKKKITNINTDESKRDKEFCIFILTYGRADKVTTYKTLMEKGVLNQDVYLICSDDDKQLSKYIEKYGDRVLVFNKQKMDDWTDRGDNFDNYKIVLYARNICFTFAKKLGYRYFVEFDDDYSVFCQRIFYDMEKLMSKTIKDYDYLFKIHLDFLKSTPCQCISMSQGGDFISGAGNPFAKRGWQRKVMNSFFCDVEKPFLFDGAMNDDVNYYVQAGRLGILNFNLFGFTLNPALTQANAGGLTDIYLENGTYMKTFYSILYSPSCVKIGKICHGENSRLHHKVNANAAYAKIIDEKYSSETYNVIHGINEDEW